MAHSIQTKEGKEHAKLILKPLRYEEDRMAKKKETWKQPNCAECFDPLNGRGHCINPVCGAYYRGGDQRAKKMEGLTVTKCYKASDGEMFEDFAEAKNHQLRLNFCANLEAHLADNDIPIAERYITTDAIMKDLDGLADVFQAYIEMKGE